MLTTNNIQMSKKGLKITDTACSNAKLSKQNNGSRHHWSQALLESMKDPDLIIKQTKKVVVIRDKYPKAKVHYLVLPREDIPSIYHLKSEHIDLLNEFSNLYEDIKRDSENDKLRAGFHAVPSMQRLHMHIISIDMISPCLKTKQHWNSFTTKFFIPFEDLMQELKHNGFIKRISSENHKSLIIAPLACNQCDYKPKNMPLLKEHLLNHIKENEL